MIINVEPNRYNKSNGHEQNKKDSSWIDKEERPTTHIQTEREKKKKMREWSRKLPIIVCTSWSQRTNYTSTGVICAAIGRYMRHGVVVVRVLMPNVHFCFIYRPIASLKILLVNIFIVLVNRGYFFVFEFAMCRVCGKQYDNDNNKQTGIFSILCLFAIIQTSCHCFFCL